MTEVSVPMVRATARLQFHREFTFDDAVRLVPYFARLGISHLYSSPILKARPGSTYGYDMVDPTCVNPELGGEAGLERLVAALRAEQMGLIVDFVPNHMAVGGDANPWWLDVLEWGTRSPRAHFFDIQWNSPDPLLKGQILLPFLRADYGEVLASGEITLHFDGEQGSFYAKHYDHVFPLYPPSYRELLGKTDHPALQAFGRRFEALEKTADYLQHARALRRELSEQVRAENLDDVIQHALAQFTVESASNDGDSDWQQRVYQDETVQRLHQLLECQHYRLASWRTAVDDINWRRFFDINELGALCMERADVFSAVHGKILELVGRGLIDGLRIDHIDGLLNPRAYCRKLRRSVNTQISRRAAPLNRAHFPIYVEKILGDGEVLPANWQVEGTTGYEFMNQISLIQHDPVGALQLYDLWHNTSGRHQSFKEEEKEARRLVLSSSLAGDFAAVAQGLLAIARGNIATRDLTLGAIQRALFELVVHFPVYRTYANSGHRSIQDQAFFSTALADARTTLAQSDWPILDYLDQWLGGEPIRSLAPGPLRRLRQRTLARFQQLTSPIAAKAVEDTACYRSAVLLSRNDVGFDPARFSGSVAQFHHDCEERASCFPHNLLATATHDHKRGEDTRARLAVISERAVWFAEKVAQWQQRARPLRTELDDTQVPSPGDELILFQTLLGSWPLDLELVSTPDLENNRTEEDEAAREKVRQQGLTRYLDRLVQWQEKALREAKLRTSWSTPNTDYEAACRQYLTRLLLAEDTRDLREDIAAAALALAPAGALNSVGQTLLRLTTPGVPDLYQGNEFWDFSLVDPDNRRPVDFQTRVNALADKLTEPDERVNQWRNGLIKQHLIAEVLAFRKAHPKLFLHGDYQPLHVEGAQAERVIAFARHFQGKYLIVVVPRLAVNLLAGSPTPYIAPEQWGDTRLILPDSLVDVRFTAVFSRHPLSAEHGCLKLASVLTDFPVNILYSIPNPISEEFHHEHE
ncbi:MAG: malto-oligosyltrehalose synthase [Cellvibrio sp.]|uniref:malto-oligosyltrehalose synthase n=1 Tax=Cellvibrio sp. TaxID=1965322 RepID=UPI0031A725A6